MPIPGTTPCGARCRTKDGAPCLNAAMRNGRCRMHGGALHKRCKHGRETLIARSERRLGNALLREMKQFNKEIGAAINEGSRIRENVESSAGNEGKFDLTAERD